MPRCSMHGQMPNWNQRADKGLEKIFIAGISDLLQDKEINQVYIASEE